MKTYELTYIISPEVNSEQIESKEKEIEGSIQTGQGVIIKQSKAAAKTLAYPIGGFSSGFFGVIEFQLEEEKLSAVKEGFNKDGKIIRNMLLIKEPVRIKKTRRSRKDEIPSILSDKKVENDAVKEDVKPEIKTPAFEDIKEEKADEPKAKVGLKDIEQELEDILGE